MSIFILKDRLPMKLWWYTLAVAATLYTLLFAVHLHLLPFSGAVNRFYCHVGIALQNRVCLHSRGRGFVHAC